MIKYQVYIYFYFFIVSITMAQNQVPEIDYPDSIQIKLFAVGESHLDDNRILQEKILLDLLEGGKIDHILLEWPLGTDKIFNRYVLFNDSTYLPQIESFAHKTVVKNYHHTLNVIRQYNNKVSEDCKVSITTIDYVNYRFLSNNLQFLAILYPELNSSEIPVTQYYLFTIADKMKKRMSREKKLAIIDSLTNDFNVKSDQYRILLGDKYELYQTSLETLKISFLKGEGFNIRTINARDAFMFSQVDSVLKQNKSCLLISGADHIDKKLNDDFGSNYIYSSLTALVEEKYPGTVFSICTQYYKRKKLIKFFDEENYLKYEMKEYFPDRSNKYVVVNPEELKEHPNAVERYDVIVIQNCRRGAK